MIPFAAVGGPGSPVPGQAGPHVPHDRQPDLGAVGLLGTGTLRTVAARGGLAPFRALATSPLLSRPGRKTRLVGLRSRHFEPTAIDGEDFKAGDGEPIGQSGAHPLSKHHHQLEHETGRPGSQHLHEGLIRPGGLLVGSLSEGQLSQRLEANLPRCGEPVLGGSSRRTKSRARP